MLHYMRSRGLALVLAGMIGAGVSLPAWSAETPANSSAEIRLAAKQMSTRAIAVVDFENHTGDAGYDNLKRGISESLMTKLARRPEFTLVERTQLDKALKEVGFSQSVYADPNKAKQIGKMINADYIVTGDVVKAGNRFEINARMIEVETAKVLVTESYNFQSENDILPVVDYLALLIPRKLNLYVSDTELDMARSKLNTGSQATAQGPDNSWIWWTIGGVVAAGAIITVVVLAATGKLGGNQNITQCVGTCTDTRGTSTDDSSFGPDLQMPLLHF